MPRKRIIVDEKERKAVAQQMKTAFETLAKERGGAFDYAGFEKPEKGRKLLRDCGESIQKLLFYDKEDAMGRRASGIRNGSIDPDREAAGAAATDQHLGAYAALRNLLEHNASPLDLCEFMFHCAYGVPSTVVGRLKHAGFSKGTLSKMASTCDELAKQLHRLNYEAIPGPLSYLFHVSKLSPDDKKFVALQMLPEYLSVCAGVLEKWPPKDYTSSLSQRRFGKHYITTYFRIYICLCHGNETDMSALLRLMRDVLIGVHSIPEQMTAMARKNAMQRYSFLQYASTNKGDPLSPQSLRMAVERFVQRNREGFGHMLVHVTNYLREPKYKTLRKKHQTFLSLLADF